MFASLTGRSNTAPLNSKRYGNEMKMPFLVIGIIFLPLFAAAEANPVVPGDYLFVYARVIGCAEQVRLVEFGQVQDSGEVLLFGDISLDVGGKAPGQIETQLTDAWEQKYSYRPTTIRIERNAEADAEERTFLLMKLYRERKRKCQQPSTIELSTDWLLAQDFSRNKSSKRPPVRHPR